MFGNIDWFSVEKRFGFIKAEDGESYFVHQNQVHELPNGEPAIPMKGDRVEFEVGISPKTGRTHATEVRIVTKEPAPRVNRHGLPILPGDSLPREALEGRDEPRWEK